MVGTASQAGERAEGETVLLGRYEVLTLLASGGMAHVYVGRRHGAQGFQRLVAIKRMRSHLLQNADMSAQFADEARIASLIQHPNVVSIHDVHEEKGELVLVMDYIDGVSLADLLKELSRRQQKVGVDVALRIVVDALRGLHAAHELRDYAGTFMNVVHRDATPTNILVGRDGSVRITDFGVAKAVAREVQTQAGYIKGKFGYMAPEQAADQPLDRRVDVFALGTVLWELLTGRPLFGGGGYDSLRAVMSGPIEAPSKHGAKVSPAQDAVVLAALERDRDRRHLTAAAFADALEESARAGDGLATPTRVAEAIGIYCLPSILERETRLKDVLSGRAPKAKPGPPSQTTLPMSSDPPTASGVQQSPQITVAMAAPSPSATLPMKMLADDSASRLVDMEVDVATAIMPSPLQAAAVAATAAPAPAPALAPAPHPPPEPQRPMPSKAMGTMLGMPVPGQQPQAFAPSPQAPPPGGPPPPRAAIVADDPFKAAPISFDEPAASFQPEPAQTERTKRMRTIVLGVVGGATLLIVAAAVASAFRKPADDASGTSTSAATAIATATSTAAATAARTADPIPPPDPVATAAPPPPVTTAAPPPPVTVAQQPTPPPPPVRTVAQPLPPPPGRGKPSKGNIVRDAPF